MIEDDIENYCKDTFKCMYKARKDRDHVCFRGTEFASFYDTTLCDKVCQ